MNLFSINPLSLHAVEQLVQQKTKLSLPPWMSHAITAVIHPVHVEISDTFKSHTDATSNYKMKENFLQDFPGEKSAFYGPEYMLF